MNAAEFPPLQPAGAVSVRRLCEGMKYRHEPRTALRIDLIDACEDLQHAAGNLSENRELSRQEAKEAIRFIERARRLINSIDIVQATALYRELADD